MCFLQYLLAQPAQFVKPHSPALEMLTRVDSSQLLIRKASVAAAAADWSVVLDKSQVLLVLNADVVLCRCGGQQMSEHYSRGHDLPWAILTITVLQILLISLEGKTYMALLIN